MSSHGSGSASLQWPDGSLILLEDVFRIGRSSSNQLVLNDELVSRQHAILQCIGDKWWVIDLGSSNGTLVNGQQIIQPTKLANSDNVRIGNSSLVFRHSNTAQASKSFAPSTMVSVRVAEQWLLVADIEGFTVLSRTLPPTEVSGLVSQWFQATSAAVENTGCRIHKYLGDGWLGGWAGKHANLDTIVGAIKSLDALRHAQRLKFRIALHVGQVTSAVAPTGVHDLVGEDINYVFRMEKIASSLGVSCLVSTVAARRLAGSIGFQSAGSHAVPAFETIDEFFTPIPATLAP